MYKKWILFGPRFELDRTIQISDALLTINSPD